MKKYLILQPNHSEINDGTAYQLSKANVEVSKEALDNGQYRDAGYIKADNLNEVFAIGNVEHDKVEKIDKFYSISCGDIIVDLDTKIAHLVAPIGFQPIRIMK